MWNGFEEKSFLYQERNAKIIYPSTRPNGKLLLKTEYLDAFPSVEIEMLKRGYTLCFLEHPTRWAPDSETEITAEFVKYVAKELGIPARCGVIGMSCGGLQGARLAELHPELVSVLYLDAPVLNLLSMMGLGECSGDILQQAWREMVATYGFSRSTCINFRKSPIDQMDVLLTNRIPIIMVYGNADTTVVYEENGKVLETYYRQHGGDIKVICKSMCDHHPHGLPDPTPIVTYMEERM